LNQSASYEKGLSVQRIAIVGNGGAGKTVLANQLGLLLGIPVTYLDALRYTDTWALVPEEVYAARQREIVAGDRWIIDGNSLRSMPVRLAAADTVIIVDPPPLVCLWGILRRRWRYRGGRHRDGVHDRITLAFVWYVAYRYRRTHSPRVRACIAEHFHGDQVVHLTSHAQADRYIDRLTRRTGGAP
jgi:adenylate kinase family enzyme